MRRSLRQRLIVFALLVSSLLLIPKAAVAQGGTIRGKVADSTGAPIAQAVITLNPGGLRATSRDDGDYVISRVPSGTYTVRARRLGYATPSASVSVADGQTVRLDFIVNHAAISLTDVVIGSRARHTAAEELAVPVDVFTPEQIHSQGTTETTQILSQLSPSV
ncbi:MAG: carboxypeptidase-like regulatory domain-containing protein, partial [Gemmatimonadaceae bacterium]